MFRYQDIAECTGGTIIGPGEGMVSAVSTDSRTVKPGELFVPLRGERFDGHAFIDVVAENGIQAILAECAWLKKHPVPPQVCCIKVKNSLRALGDLAAAYRHRFTIPVIGVTGSNGKTTTKEMIAAILQQSGPGLKTSGNLNNLIGVPQMLFQLTPEHQWAVLEMGMSEPGEIDRLAELCKPKVGVVLNALPAHLQSMGSVEAVAAAKGELLYRISDAGLAVINADDSRVSSLGQNPSARRLSFGIKRGEVRAKNIVSQGLIGQTFQIVTPKGEIDISLAAPGLHNIYNALAAATATLDMVPLDMIARGLGSFTPFYGRFKPMELQGFTLIDDTYNANPASVKAALETMAQLSSAGRTYAVLGDMLELGEQEAEAHQAVGAVAARAVQHLFLLGSRMCRHAAEGARQAGMAPAAIHCFSTHEALAGELAHVLQPGDVVLLKGSRGMTMERISTMLQETFHQQP